MADEKTTEKASAKTAATPERELPVFLYLGHPHTRFELSGVGLEDLVPEGTAYTPAEADIVRMMCLKYGIRVLDSK